MEVFDIEKYEAMKRYEPAVMIPMVLFDIFSLYFIGYIMTQKLMQKEMTEFQGVLLLTLPFIDYIGIVLFMKKFGRGFLPDTKINDILKNYIREMPCSDETVRKLQNTLAAPVDPADRFYLQCLLADQAAKRGEKEYAEQVIFSVNTDVFDKYPKLALDYYAVMIEIYYLAEDWENVRAAYSEGEEYFNEYGQVNSLMYGLMLDIYISSCLAYGIFSEAERAAEYRLNRINTSNNADKTDAVTYCFYIIQTAECNLRNNNITAAVNHCENALQLAPQGTFAAYKASKLMSEINSYRQ